MAFLTVRCYADLHFNIKGSHVDMVKKFYSCKETVRTIN